MGAAHESKHIACARCRDRKVKCDGGKPACKRCIKSGTLCQYVRSRKENTRSEWSQHLRTFSSQPGGIHTARHKSDISSQPRLPHTPYMHARHKDKIPFQARSPSPFLLEHKMVEVNSNRQAITKKDSFMYYDNVPVMGSSPIWQPAPTKCNFVDAHAYSFEPSNCFEPADSFHNTQFTSHLLTTSSSPEDSPMHMPSARHHMPALQGWDLTNYDGLLDIQLPVETSIHHAAAPSKAVDYVCTPMYNGVGGNYIS